MYIGVGGVCSDGCSRYSRLSFVQTRHTHNSCAKSASIEFYEFRIRRWNQTTLRRYNSPPLFSPSVNSHLGIDYCLRAVNTTAFHQLVTRLWWWKDRTTFTRRHWHQPFGTRHSKNVSTDGVWSYTCEWRHTKYDRHFTASSGGCSSTRCIHTCQTPIRRSATRSVWVAITGTERQSWTNFQITLSVQVVKPHIRAWRSGQLPDSVRKTAPIRRSRSLPHCVSRPCSTVRRTGCGDTVHRPSSKVTCVRRHAEQLQWRSS